MSKDGIILDPRNPVVFKVDCYSCGNPIDLSQPIAGHEVCTEEGYSPEPCLKFSWSQESDNFEV
jgi:hypothetical protein